MTITINVLTNKLDSGVFRSIQIYGLITLIISASIGFFLGEKIKSRVLLAAEEYKKASNNKSYDECISEKFKGSYIGLLLIIFFVTLIIGSILLFTRCY